MPSFNTSSLDDLLRDVSSGSTDALAKLYEQTRVGVYAFALSIVRNSMDAEDVLQDCYVQIFRNAASYSSQQKPMAWILTIARNLCFKRLKERSRMAQLNVEDWDPLLSSDMLDTDDRIVLEGCLKLLSDEERQIVVLHAVSGFKHRQTAELLNIPLSTVLSKYHRAIKKLKASLQRERLS